MPLLLPWLICRGGKKVFAKEYVSILLGKHCSHFWLMNSILAYMLQYHELRWWACCPQEKDPLTLSRLRSLALEWDIQREAPTQPNSASVVEDTSLGAMATQSTSIGTQSISTSIQEWRAPWMHCSIARHGGPVLTPGQGRRINKGRKSPVQAFGVPGKRTAGGGESWKSWVWAQIYSPTIPMTFQSSKPHL